MSHNTAGWSLFDKIHLKRVADKATQDGPHPSLGEHLIRKAKEGVRVCLLIWDDKTSFNNPFLLKSGMMATHDEDTRRYFRGSKVRSQFPCLVSPIKRGGGGGG